jgi:hypothetical protein
VVAYVCSNLETELRGRYRVVLRNQPTTKRGERAMRKILVFAILGLMFFWGLPSGVLSQSQTSVGSVEGQTEIEPSLAVDQIPVYTVDFMRSISGTTIQVMTAISIVNEGTDDCPTSVDWFFGGGVPPTLACTTTLTLSPKQALHHCSRSVGDTFVLCSASCSPALTFNQGRAVVGTTSKCKSKIAVDARVYYTTSGDAQVTGVADVKVTNYKTPAKGY